MTQAVLLEAGLVVDGSGNGCAVHLVLPRWRDP